VELTRILQRDLVDRWGSRSVHHITKRDVIDLVTSVVERGAPVGANKVLKVTKSFFNWCVGRAILDRSPTEGVKAPTAEITRDRVLSDEELAKVLIAGRQLANPYGGIVEMLTLTAQRRQEVARMTWEEIDLARRVWTLSGSRTKNGKPHVVQLSGEAIAVLAARAFRERYVFSIDGNKPFKDFAAAKLKLDHLSGVTGWRLHDLRRTAVSGMARLGVAPHVADRILNHTSGTISGVAAVYQRHEFMEERREALERWGRHIAGLLMAPSPILDDIRGTL
jgi:integrase